MPRFHFSHLLVAAIVVSAPFSACFGFTKSGKTYTTDGSQADVQAALNNASAGDTVKVPSGTFTWGTGFNAVNINTAVNLIGAGETSTTINLDPSGPDKVYGTIQIFAPAVVGYLKINGSPNNPVGSSSANNNVIPFAVGSTSGWRITHVTYDATNGGTAQDAGYFAFISGSNGLIDNCHITGGAGNNELIFARGPTNAWQTPDSAGTANAVYVEDCTFGGQGYVSDFNSNCRAVVRYCTITANMKIDGHGMDSNSPARSFREIEAYRNTWTNGGAAAFEIRGATGFLFDNTVTNATPTQCWFQIETYGVQSYWPNYGQTITAASIGNPTTITTSKPHGLQTGWGPIQIVVHNPVSGQPDLINGKFTVTVTGANTFTIPVNLAAAGVSGYETEEQTPLNYPLPDQIGVGEDPIAAHSDPLYLWNNTAQGGADWTLNWKNVAADAITLYQSQTGNPSATFTMQDLIQADRDYFKQTVGTVFDGSTGVGRGTTADMNAIAPTKVGVGFWVTDQGSWNKSTDGKGNGELYAWDGSHWTLKYVPYTYPHPARLPAAASNVNLQ